MIKSMTGFGRGECTIDNKVITIEMKSVNHRYCDINIRMPRKLIFLENDLKNRIKNFMSRGKIDVFLTYEDHSEKSQSLVFNESIAGEYLNYFGKMSEKFGIENDVKVSALSRYPEVLKLEEQEDDESVYKELTFNSLDQAINRMMTARIHEGEHLYTDLNAKLDEMIDFVEHIKEISPHVIQEYKNKLEARIEELTDKALLDESRMAMEVAMFADKSCIDEEIVRLESHIKQMKTLLDMDDPTGRKLDFVAQEMNREANTVLSKANNVNVSNEGINLKTLIEKIREQIQNIE